MKEEGRQSGSAGQNCFWSHLREFGCHLLRAPGWSLVIFPLISKSKSADKSLGSLFLCQTGGSELLFMSLVSSGFLPASAIPSECCILVPKTCEIGALLQALYTDAFWALLPAHGLLGTLAPIMKRNNSIPTWSILQLTWPVLTLRLCPLQFFICWLCLLKPSTCFLKFSANSADLVPVCVSKQCCSSFSAYGSA